MEGFDVVILGNEIDKAAERQLPADKGLVVNVDVLYEHGIEIKQ